MTPEQLKESILQMAIQGKLVEQIAEEGTALDLLEDIKIEKEKLIKDGKIPKEKKLPDITEEEKEYEIPENWRYVRVQDIASYITDYVANGSFATLKKNITTYKIPNYAIFVRTMDLTANFVGECSYIDQKSYEFLEKSKLYGGELILPNIGGSIGKAFLMPDLGMPMSLAPNSIMLKFKHTIMNKFFSYIIQAPYGKKFLIDTKGGTATPKFSKTELRNMVVMLPPLKEIERIVAKIEEMLPFVDRYAASYEKLEQFNAKFPEDMKKSILQYAIQGKLVEQRPEEGTAEELYRQIQEEKQKLIKEGKIKKEKPLAEITEDEIPFDIPENWKWVRLGDCSTYNQTKEKIAPNDITNDMWSLDLEDIQKETGCILVKKLAGERKISGDKVKFYRGQVLYSKLRPYLKKILVAPDDGICTPELVPFNTFGITPEYLVFVLKSPHVDYMINAVTYGVKMPRVGTDTMTNLLIPLPPLEEQYRIVAKIEELLPYCNQLIK